MAAVGFARVQAGALSLAVLHRGHEGVWVVPVLCDPPMKCANRSVWQAKVGWPPEQAAPADYTASVPVATVLEVLPQAERARVAKECPQMLFMLSVPGGTLEVLRHTPVVTKVWVGPGGGDLLAALCGAPFGLPVADAAPGPPPPPPPPPLPHDHPMADAEDEGDVGDEGVGGDGPAVRAEAWFLFEQTAVLLCCILITWRLVLRLLLAA